MPDLSIILEHIGSEFNLPGRFVMGEPYGSGHINDTYRVRWEADNISRDYIHQRINHKVFKNPVHLMENIERVTSHQRAKIMMRPGADPLREALSVIPSVDGRSYYQDDLGFYWRTYHFITDATTYDICPSPAQAREGARAFGLFQAALVDLPGARLHETIPWFHHTPRRLQALEEAITKDTHNRAGTARNLIEFCLQRKPTASTITNLLESGAIPERITHNDTKFNNVMIDDHTGRGVCVIDLDTVMCGCALYDFGDMVRTTTRPCAEDERNLARIKIDLDFFEALVAGYMETAGAFLTPLEIEYLAFSGNLITFTIGIRFLTDYLMGDVYFKVHRPDHNLDRACVQFRMVADMEAKHDRMVDIVKKYQHL